MAGKHNNSNRKITYNFSNSFSEESSMTGNNETEQSSETTAVACEITSPDRLADEIANIAYDLMRSLDLIRTSQIKDGADASEFITKYESEDVVLTTSGLVFRGFMLSGELEGIVTTFYENHKIDVDLGIGISGEHLAEDIFPGVDEEGNILLTNPKIYIVVKVSVISEDNAEVPTVRLPEKMESLLRWQA